MKTISEELDNKLWRRALENAGVDNWEWYGESMEEYEKQVKEATIELNSEELIDMFDDFVSDNYQPQSEGHGLDYINREVKDNELLDFIKDLVNKQKEIKENV